MEFFAAATIDGQDVRLPYGSSDIISGLKLDMTLRQGEGYALLKPVISSASAPSGRISHIRSLSLTLPCLADARLHTLRGDDCSKDSFLPIDKTFADGEELIMKPTGGRSSNTTSFPFFDITLDGAAYLFAVGWSGQWRARIARSGGSLTVDIGLEYGDFYLTGDDQALALPSVLVMTGEDPKALRHNFRFLMQTTFSPLPRGMDHLPISIQPFDRYFGRNLYWTTEEGQKETIAKASLCGGFDTLWIDAAWFTEGFPYGVGNYTIIDGFPRGLKPVSEAAHAAGMRFMVWFEPERIYKGSEVYRDHPDFLLSSGDENTFLYNLGNEEAWTWLKDTLVTFIADNGIDNYRQDFNMDPLEYWLKNDEPGREGLSEVRYINGLYRLWDALKEAYPGLMIDDCASGGRRIDFETMRRAVPMWRSDITCGPITQEAHNDVWNQNETLTLAEYLPYHACACWEPILNDIRAAATAGLACTFDILNPNFDFEAAQAVLQEVKRRAGAWLYDFIPLTEPTLDESVWAAWQLAGEKKGFAEFFRRADCPRDTFLFRPARIKADKSYSIVITDERHNKSALTLDGLSFMRGVSIICPQPHTSAALEYEETEG